MKWAFEDSSPYLDIDKPFKLDFMEEASLSWDFNSSPVNLEFREI